MESIGSAVRSCKRLNGGLVANETKDCVNEYDGGNSRDCDVLEEHTIQTMAKPRDRISPSDGNP